MSVFKAYDIRGTVPDQLDADLAYRIGVGTAMFLGSGEVVVGRDARTHSPEIADALMAGIVAGGAGVIDIGRVTTPMVYHATEAQAAAGGVMVTASHNPGQYNGFKICREHAIPIGEASGLKTIEQLAMDCALADYSEATVSAHRASGKIRSADTLQGYLDHVLTVGGRLPKRRIKVAIDFANGMAGVAVGPLIERWQQAGLIEVVSLYMEPDGRFPNHEADPLKPENLEDLVAAVHREGADLGVAFDGDGDRAVFVDDAGEPISSDLMTGLLSRYLLASHPQGRILYDLRSSRAVAEEIEAAGGCPEMCRVGHSFVKAEMRQSGAIFAGELSGHFYFRFSDQLMADDAVAAFVAVLDVLAAEDPKALSELVHPLRRYFASGEINRKVASIEAFLERIEREHADAPVISHLDGLYVRYPDWWFNLRASNTEPVLRLNLEADSREKMEAERDALLGAMGAA